MGDVLSSSATSTADHNWVLKIVDKNPRNASGSRFGVSHSPGYWRGGGLWAPVRRQMADNRRRTGRRQTGRRNTAHGRRQKTLARWQICRERRDGDGELQTKGKFAGRFP